LTFEIFGKKAKVLLISRFPASNCQSGTARKHFSERTL
jgi:hypothetical protein